MNFKIRLKTLKGYGRFVAKQDRVRTVDMHMEDGQLLIKISDSKRPNLYRDDEFAKGTIMEIMRNEHQYYELYEVNDEQFEAITKLLTAEAI